MDGREKITISAKDVGTLRMTQPTRAERLQALCEKKHPSYAAFATGGCCEGKHGAIYNIQQLGPTKWQARITDPVSGDSLGGVGETLDAAITALEGKIK